MEIEVSKESEEYVLKIDGAVRLSTKNEKGAKNLEHIKQLITDIKTSTKEDMLNRMKNVNAFVGSGFRMVEVGSEIYRQLTVLDQNECVFYMLFDPDQDETMFVDHDGSTILKKPGNHTLGI